MRIGLKASQTSYRVGNYHIDLVCPDIRIGYFGDTYYTDEKWMGVQLNLRNNLSYEQYDYGWVLCMVLLGFGVSINKMHM
jgi:hypothetical protein